LALLQPVRPDLALIVQRWDALPEAVRSGLLSIVQSHADGQTDQTDQTERR
jgi:hypothetical protein